MSQYLLAIDQGTTSSRAIIFDREGKSLGVGQQEFPQIFPDDGWVEHDAEAIWDSVQFVVAEAMQRAGVTAADIAAAGITNQRETTVVWDRATSKPIHNAIVWQDRRTADVCKGMSDAGHGDDITARTGLLIDPYFSGTKLAWILDNVGGARARAEAGELAFGTIDTWLLWKLTGGAEHATDATNACRTLMFNIHEQCWDDSLLELLRIPKALLPEVRDSSADFGATSADLFGGAIPIRSLIGDQQAAAVGQACFQPGMIKSTYGTGCFMVLNTGETPLKSDNRLLTTVCYRLHGKVTYALEGSIFIAGAAVQWLRDAVQLVGHASETEGLARSVDSTGGVYLVPAFTGLGAPYWDPKARGALLGLTRDSGIAEIVRAGLESVCYQTRDLLEAMQADGAELDTLRVDGGMVANDWVVQFLADMLGKPVERPLVTETTALGAAYLAGLAVGVYESLEDIGQQWQVESRLEPQMSAADRDQLYGGWQDAVRRVRCD